MINVNNVSGQLGNRLMRLNNALQLSKKHKKTVKLKGKDNITNDIYTYFKFNLGNYPKNGNNIQLNPGDMGKLFFKNLYDPKDLIKLRHKYKFSNNKTNIAIHIRYYPIKNKKAREFLNNEKILEEYYINSINECIKEFPNANFIIFGAISSNQFNWDKCNELLTAYITKFKFYKRMIKYLESSKISFEYSITINNPKEKYIKDFMQMCDCDVIISSHSTFCICAGYLGKEKKIIHNKTFVNYFVKKKDIFWCDLNNGGNEYYKLWKLI